MIDVKHDQGVWRITLNRPTKANALTMDMLTQISAAAHNAHQDPDLRAVILTGAGDRVFCAGADVGEDTDMFAMTRDPAWQAASDSLANLPCLTIAALNGTCAGGGFSPMLACDIRICTPHTKFFYPVLKRGLLPQPADVKRLSALIGPSRAKMILLAGQKLSAEQALAYGLVEKIVESDALEMEVQNLIEDVCNAAPIQSAAIKHMFEAGLGSEALEDCYKAAYDKDENALRRIMKQR